MMKGIVIWLLSWLTKKGFKDIVDSTMEFIRKSRDNELALSTLASNERVADRKMETEVMISQVNAAVATYNAASAASVARSPQQLANPLFWAIVIVFLSPLAFYWGFLSLYNVFWCSKCMAPQPWIIAEFPEQSVLWANTMIQWIFGPLAIGSAVGIAVGSVAKTMRR